MEGTFLPNKPVYLVPIKRPSQSNNKPLKFSSTTFPLPPQSQSPPSLPIDSLLQHLHQLSSPPNTTQTSKSIKPPKTNNPQFPSLHISSDIYSKASPAGPFEETHFSFCSSIG
ncbi:pentatricopeptide repeat-containing protein [Corchorus capsularis]|uniref:Pentatricopeptide repeat-containing protein n=1 Tax=Corchorus capsularis TaxID=210143 RepID=A0A1R3IMV0_COCAP|nr:pentatricopeptide repeat-containing protein [Corchorus capsularis]